MKTEDTKFDKLLASFIAFRLKNEKNIKISGVELELLEQIANSKRLISNKKLSKLKNLPLASVEYVTKNLEKKRLITSGWKITLKGKEILEEATSLYELSKKLALEDRVTSMLIKVSGTHI